MTPATVTVSKSGRKGLDAFSDMRPFRIAMLSIHSSPLGELGTGDTGGMSVFVRELSREIGRAGHSVDIYTCADNGRHDPEYYLSDNVRVIHLGIGGNGRVAKGMLYEHLSEVFRSLDTYVTSHCLSYDLIHSHYWLSGIVGSLARDRWLSPHVVTFHTTGMAKRISCAGEKEPAHRLIAEKRLACTSDRIFSATQRERDLLVKYYNAPLENIRTVPCGVDLERFQPVTRELARKELGVRETESIVLYVGRFAPVKGLDRLIAAAAYLRSRRGLEFVIIGGDGPQTHAVTELKRLTKKASIEDMVRFLGRVEHELLPLYYSAADVLVVPSYYESFGLVGLEALACGTPVIAGHVGAMDTLIRDGKAGLLVDTMSPRSLAEAIESFIVMPQSTAASRKEIRASVLGYGWDNMASAVLQEYAAVVQPCAVWK
ncbi:MAG TPA: glycosyltransferase [Thermodesulfovibrionales bacterium]|nr:glycosyltransferase [Thermodesulfovibrionales bacterium]